MEHAKFRCIIDAMKHAFAREHTGGAYAVEPSHELIIEPSLNAVGVAEPVKFDVGPDHDRRDPRAALARAWRGGAGRNDPFKCLIDGETKGREGALGFSKI